MTPVPGRLPRLAYYTAMRFAGQVHDLDERRNHTLSAWGKVQISVVQIGRWRH